MDYDIEDNINVAIMNDNIDEFIKWSKKMAEWDKYYIKDFDEYFLHSAVRNKSLQILKYMIENKVDLNLKDGENKTALHLSIEEGLCAIIKEFLHNEIEFCCDKSGNNELHKLVTHHPNCEECLKLFSKFANLHNNHFNKKNKKGNSALMQAVIDEDLPSIKLIIKYFKFEFEQSGEDDNSLLHYAASSKNEDIFFFLIDQFKFDYNKKNKKSETPLTIALLNENFKICEKLVDLGSNISSADKRLAYEKSNKTFYAKLKKHYEEQQKGKIKNLRNTTHHSNSGIKAVVMEDEFINDYRNCSMKKLKQSQDFFHKFNANKLSLDSNSNNSQEEKSSSEKGSSGNNTVTLYSKLITNEQKQKKEINEKIPINPFGNTKETSHGSNSSSLILNTIQNSPFKTGGKSPNRSPIPTTLNSNFFLKEKIPPQTQNISLIINNSKNENPKINNQNNVKPMLSPTESRRFSSFLNKHINLDLVTFEFIKSFTNLSLKDIVKEEIIYSADICNVFRGKYLSLPVAIKVYNIVKLEEDDLVI